MTGRKWRHRTIRLKNRPAQYLAACLALLVLLKMLPIRGFAEEVQQPQEVAQPEEVADTDEIYENDEASGEEIQDEFLTGEVEASEKDYSFRVSMDERAGISKTGILTAEELDSNSEEYTQYVSEIAALSKDAECLYVRLFKLSFTVGDAIQEPSVPVTAALTLDEAIPDGNIDVLQLAEDGVERADDMTYDSQTGTFQFTLNHFSTVAVVVTAGESECLDEETPVKEQRVQDEETEEDSGEEGSSLEELPDITATEQAPLEEAKETAAEGTLDSLPVVGKGPRKVSGNQVAEDGTYSAVVTATKNKDGKKYYGTVYVTVADGKIAGLSIYASKKSDRFQAALNSVLYDYIGKAARADVDAVSSASLSGGTSSGKYSMDLTQAIQTALAGAPAKTTPGAETPAEPVADGVYTGTCSMENGHYITLNVTVKNGVIDKLEIANADGSWDSLLSEVSGSYVGGPAEAETVDAVSSATTLGYQLAIRNAISDALKGAPNSPEEPKDPGTDHPGTETPSGDPGGSLVLSKKADTNEVCSGESFSLDLEAYTTAAEIADSSGEETGANIVVTIDISGSMSNQGAALKSAIQNLVDSLPDDSQVGVVTFTGTYNGTVEANAITSNVYTKETVSGLSFPAVSGSSYSNMAPGINAAQALLNDPAQWDHSENNKVIVVISDFEDDYFCNAINAAYQAKRDGITVYSVKTDSSSVNAPSDEIYFYDKPNASHSCAQYVSNNYPNASATNSTFFNYAFVTPGTGSIGNGYAFGASGGNWSEIFSTIRNNEAAYSTVSLGKDAVFQDVVNTEQFDVFGATATVTVWDYENGTWTQLSETAGAACGSAGTLSDWTGKTADDGTLTVTFDPDGTVTVTGFSYRDHFLPESGTEADGVSAQKVHLTISGLKLKEGAQTSELQTDVPTNDEAKSGVFEQLGDNEPVKNFPLPTVSIPGGGKEDAPVDGVSRITVKKEWAEGSTPADSVTVEIMPDSGDAITETLSSDSGWAVTVEADPAKKYTVRETAVTRDGQDVTARYIAEISEPVIDTATGGSGAAWTQIDSVQGEGFYAFVFSYGGEQYLLGASGTSLTAVKYSGDSTAANNCLWSVIDTGRSANGYSFYHLKNNATGTYLTSMTSTTVGLAETADSANSSNADVRFNGANIQIRFGSNGFSRLNFNGSAFGRGSANKIDFTYYSVTQTGDETTAVYTITNTEKHKLVQVSFIVIGENDSVLPDAEFTMDSFGSLTSGEDGKLADSGGRSDFTLEFGTYTLQEIRAPDGYKALDGPVTVEAGENGVAVSGGTCTVTGDAETAYIVTIPCVREDIPETGIITDNAPFAVLIMAACAGVGIIFASMRRKHHKAKEYQG